MGGYIAWDITVAVGLSFVAFVGTFSGAIIGKSDCTDYAWALSMVIFAARFVDAAASGLSHWMLHFGAPTRREFSRSVGLHAFVSVLQAVLAFVMIYLSRQSGSCGVGGIVCGAYFAMHAGGEVTVLCSVLLLLWYS